MATNVVSGLGGGASAVYLWDLTTCRPASHNNWASPAVTQYRRLVFCLLFTVSRCVNSPYCVTKGRFFDPWSVTQEGWRLGNAALRGADAGDKNHDGVRKNHANIVCM